MQRAANPGKANGGAMSGVSCTGPSACTAVGYYFVDGIGDYAPVAERWNGIYWAPEAIPSPTPSSYLSWVSCTAAARCEAVGGYYDQTANLHPFAAGWDGTKWRIQQMLAPPGAPLVVAAALHCSAPDACTVVGEYLDSSGVWLPLAERWDGTRWTLQSMPVPSDATLTYLYGVSCPAANGCIAAGFYRDATGTELTLAERWDGTGWTIEPSPNPVGAEVASFDDVSCSSPTACTAVGFWTDGTGASHPLAEVRR
jgi:hypothetical protein